MKRATATSLFRILTHVVLWRSIGAALGVGLLGNPVRAAVSPFVPTLAPLPTDTTALVEGAPAVLVDPASAGMSRGAEWMLRRAGTDRARGWGAGALSGVLPLGPVTLGLGYERASLFGAGPTRLGAIVSVGVPQARIGFAVRRLFWQQGHTAVSTDVSAAHAPTGWLRLALGVDNLLAPRLSGTPVALTRMMRVGVAARPLGAQVPVALAVDAHVPLMRPAEQMSGSLSVIAPLARGVEAVAGGRLGGAASVFVGLRASASALDAEVTGTPWQQDGASSVGSRLNAQARIRSRPTGPRLLERPREVRFVLPDALEAAPSWLGSSATIDMPLVVRLRDIARTRAHERVVLEFDTLPVGMATIESLMAAIGSLRQAGVHVEARSVELDARSYLVAAACSTVVLDATGQIDLSGFASKKLFYGGALHRAGIDMHAIAAGDHKTGADGYSRSEPRPEEANNRQPLVDAADGMLVQALTEGRRLSGEHALAARNEGLVGAERALSLHLIDRIGPSVDVEHGKVTPLSPVALAPPVRPSGAYAPAPTVCVVPVRGVLGADPWTRLFGEAVDDEAVERALEAAAQQAHVIGVVLAIDSPGGDVASSERLWRAVRRLSARKPVVAALGDVAASGGYYVAVAASRIFAGHTSVTGSIGVYRLQPDASGLLRLLGITRDVRARGPHADSDSVAHALCDEDRAMFARSVDESYAQFWARVRAARHLRDEERDAVAGGRVWLGESALHNGLVDAIGDVADAADWLAADSGDARAHVVVETANTRGASWLSRVMSTAKAKATPNAWQSAMTPRNMALLSLP